MEKFKDFLYNISDIILGTVILLILIGYIFFNMKGYFSQLFIGYSSKNVVTSSQEFSTNVKNDSFDSLSFDDSEVSNISIKIDDNMSDDDVAKLLKDKNLIDSKDEFLSYLKKNKLDKSIKSGSFSISTPCTIEDIVKIITDDNKE